MDAQRGIARRLVIGLPDDGLPPAWERDIAMYAPAGFIVFRRHFRDLDDLRRLTARLRELARPRRVFIALDEEGGFVSQLAGHLTVPPNAALLARGAAPGDLEYVARVTGERLRALGFDWDFAPVADVHSEADNPVIGPRAFGVTPAAVSAAIGDWLAGFRAAGIASCLKHFPGHGDTVLDSHVALPRFDGDLATLEARELAPYRAHLDADSVMTAHVVYPALDPAAPGSLSRAVTHGLLRE
jgi:beta-N-acetylhexosaminidase